MLPDSQNPVNFELYKIFYYAADEMNFSKAAQKLHVTQSAISQAIKSLESQLDVHLFFRQGRSIKLTFEGEILFQHIEKAFNFIKSAESSLASIKSLDEGTIFIGASDTITRYLLMTPIKHFNEHYPKVKISINNRPSPRSVERLRKGEIDLAIININPHINYEGLAMYPLSQIENIFIASTSLSKFLDNSKHHLSVINQYPIICLEEKSTTRKILEHFYEQHGEILNPSFEFGSLDVIINAVKSNMGIGFVTKNAIQNELGQGAIKILETFEVIPKTEIGILVNKTKPLSIAAQTFLDNLLNMN